MKLRRLVHPDAAAGARLALSTADLHHLRHVLRLRQGAALEVGDGRGNVWRAILNGWEPPQIEVGGDVLAAAPTCALSIVSCLALLRGPRMDWAVEKLSELGVERLIPLLGERSQGRPRLERWRRIAVESARQCGRSVLLEVEEPVPLAELASRLGPDTAGVLLDPGGEPLARCLGASSRVLLASGPEGGFAPGEVAFLREIGLRRARLPAPLMRAETAAVAGVAGVLTLADR